MYINIKLKEKTSSGSTIRFVNFPVDVGALKAATLSAYLESGTQYDPIRSDNYISLGNNQFPSISPNTTLIVSLSTKEIESCKEDEKRNMPENGRLVCCMVKNVGKAFNNNLMEIVSNSWGNIFEMDSGNLISAPDGTLYISTDKKGECKIQTKNKASDSYLSYSILFSFIFEDRNYYFILDPVIRITSSGNG
jgi:hypothetical protein